MSTVRPEPIDLDAVRRAVEDTTAAMTCGDDWGEATKRSGAQSEVDTHEFGIAILTRDGEPFSLDEEVARTGRFLILDTVEEPAQQQLEKMRRARRILALMMTSGLYDGAGDFAYRVGLPAKSGVGGGILAIAPNAASIAAWSPGLNQSGNSLLGTRALEMLTDLLDWSAFGRVETR